ncbi:hypothetical protein [Nocardia amamiensis]|uniref:hypothetical protein n=1 Tax=Nocardia amamiensis TaxID=404578 RepID=UPI000A47FF80|nr:hypothetical protein [Nocardia amamiensis]
MQPDVQAVHAVVPPTHGARNKANPTANAIAAIAAVDSGFEPMSCADRVPLSCWCCSPAELERAFGRERSTQRANSRELDSGERRPQAAQRSPEHPE